MSSIHQQALEMAWEKKSKDRDWFDAVYDVYAKLKSGYYDNSLGMIDAIFQSGHWANSLTLDQAYGFLLIWSLIQSGDLLHAPIGPIGTPEADREIELNNEKLAKLRAPFSAKFFGRLGDSDGFFGWSEPLYLMNSLEGRTEKVAPRPAQEFHVALEVGSTQVSRTYLHLYEKGGIARWPYGCPHIWLFVLVPQKWDEWLQRTSIAY